MNKYQTELPELVIKDIRLPGMDGIEALNAVLGKDRQAVIFIEFCGGTPLAVRKWRAGPGTAVRAERRRTMAQIEFTPSEIDLLRKILQRYLGGVIPEIAPITSSTRSRKWG